VKPFKHTQHNGDADAGHIKLQNSHRKFTSKFIISCTKKTKAQL